MVPVILGRLAEAREKAPKGPAALPVLPTLNPTALQRPIKRNDLGMLVQCEVSTAIGFKTKIPTGGACVPRPPAQRLYT